jgi:hypothetical protein
MAKLPGAIAGARIVGERFAHSRRQNPEGRMPLLDNIRELHHRIVKNGARPGHRDDRRGCPGHQAGPGGCLR